MHALVNRGAMDEVPSPPTPNPSCFPRMAGEGHWGAPSMLDPAQLDALFMSDET